MNRPMLSLHLPSATCLLVVSLSACGGKTADSWSQPADQELGGTGASATTGGAGVSAIGGNHAATGGSSATAAGGSFDVATGGAFIGTGGSAAPGELVPITIDPALLTTESCGRDSLLKITGSDATGCSVPVPHLLYGVCGTALANPDLINVYFTRGEGKTFIVPRTHSECYGHGWNLDPGGTILSLCPETCEAVSQDSAAAITITFDCYSVPCIT